MALHDIPAEMLKESLVETLDAAKYCSYYKKVDKKWGKYATGGCLGYPSGILLFSIIDSIGSYYRKNKEFKITIDGKPETINADGWEHFKILNSKYFNQSLSLDFIKKLYSHFRSKLTHNSILGDAALMLPDNNSIKQLKGKNQAFAAIKNNNNKTIYFISIKELCQLCDSAVTEFIKDIDEVVPKSKQGKGFN